MQGNAITLFDVELSEIRLITGIGNNQQGIYAALVRPVKNSAMPPKHTLDVLLKSPTVNDCEEAIEGAIRLLAIETRYALSRMVVEAEEEAKKSRDARGK